MSCIPNITYNPAKRSPLNVALPKDCPFSIRPMNDEGSLFLIRENDKFGEYPNIYVKIVSPAKNHSVGFDASRAKLIVLCDTGCGTNTRPIDRYSRDDSHTHWDIGRFLETTVNPENRLPYLIITSHCHYDHILGIANLNIRRSIVLSSAYDKAYITPRSHLAKHSLCDDLGIPVPEYDVGIWADDYEKVVVHVRLHLASHPVHTGITILQTPGHTPDSLTWYDSTLSPPHIFVGDSLYERQSEDTKTAKWGREPPMPTLFTTESNLADWSNSVDKVIKFVKERNLELKTTASEAEDCDWLLVSQNPRRGHCTRVMLGAAHVTVSVDAEKCLVEMRDFVQRIIRDEVPHCLVKDENGHEVWLWDDVLDVGATKGLKPGQQNAQIGRFSVRAPLSLIEKARERTTRNISHDARDEGSWSEV